MVTILTVGGSPPARIEEPSIAEPTIASTSVYPVVLIPGWQGEGIGCSKMWDALQAAGCNMVDFTGVAYDQSGITTKAISYVAKWLDGGFSFHNEGYSNLVNLYDNKKFKDAATQEIVIKGDGIREIAAQVWGYITQKVIFEGSSVWYDSATGKWHTPKINVVTHSMGGLVSRVLLKDNYATGKINNLINIQSPHWGVPVANWASDMPDLIQDIEINIISKWSATAWDMRVGSEFMQWINGADGKASVTDTPQPDMWSCIAGSPGVLFSALPGNNMNSPADFANDGKTNVADTNDLTGFDLLVPQDGAWLVGADNYITKDNHAKGQYGQDTVQTVISILGSAYTYTGPNIPLIGNCFIRVQGFRPESSPDWGLWTNPGDPYYKVWVDVDGDDYCDDWISLGQIDPDVSISPGEYWRDVSNTMQTSVLSLAAYSTSFINVKVEVWDKDPWYDPSGDDKWCTFVIEGICASSNVDKVNSYYRTDIYGNDIWIQANGYTNRADKVAKLEVDFSKARIDVNCDPWPMQPGEISFVTWAGIPNYEKFYSFGYNGPDNYPLTHRNDNYYDDWGKDTVRAIEAYDRNTLLAPKYVIKSGNIHLKVLCIDDDPLDADDVWNAPFDWTGPVSSYLNGGWFGWGGGSSGTGYDLGDWRIWLNFRLSSV